MAGENAKQVNVQAWQTSIGNIGMQGVQELILFREGGGLKDPRGSSTYLTSGLYRCMYSIDTFKVNQTTRQLNIMQSVIVAKGRRQIDVDSE